MAIRASRAALPEFCGRAGVRADSETEKISVSGNYVECGVWSVAARNVKGCSGTAQFLPAKQIAQEIFSDDSDW